MGKMRKSPFFVYVLVVLDWATIVGSLVAAIVLRGRDFHATFTFVGAPIYGELVFLGLYGAGVTLVFHYYNLYRINVFTTVVDHTVRILKALFIAVLGIGLMAFFLRADFILDSRLAITYFTIICFLMMVGGRVMVFRNLYLFLSRHRVFHRNALIVGAGTNAKNVAINLFLNDHLRLNLIGFLDDEIPIGQPVFNGRKILGKVDEIIDLVKVFDVHEIIMCLENVTQERFISVLEMAIETNRTVKISSPLYDVIPERLDIEKYGSVAVVGVSQVGPSPVFEAYKRVFDSVGAAFAMLLLAPVFFLTALAIRLDTPGPIFFAQIRIGKNGKPFRFFKFRSMTVGSEKDAGREQKYASLIKGDYKVEAEDTPTKIVDVSRVTEIGAFLRKTSLDELPQLYNVLRGDMSLVGPRPCLPYEWKYYEEWHKRRLSVTPGCTGMWQVVGRSRVGFQDMVVLDLFYAQNASFHLDMWLLLKTIPVMVLGRGGK